MLWVLVFLDVSFYCINNLIKLSGRKIVFLNFKTIIVLLTIFLTRKTQAKYNKMTTEAKFITSIRSNATMPTWGWWVRPELTKAVRETDKHRILTDVMNGKLPAYSHQQELITRVSQHLEKSSTAPKLNISYQTPTGSGKTSSLLLLQDHLRKNHPDVILVMGAPATLLSRAIPELEAQHESNYWMMSQVENGDYRVIRPKSSMINVRREKKKWQGIIKEDDESFTGKKTTTRPNENKDRDPTITQQMWQANQHRARARDPIPNVILADIFAIRKMLQELANPIALSMPNSNSEPDRPTLPNWLRRDNMVLFLDEPNMGIINPDIQQCIRDILVLKPSVCILASATLGDWANIPSWWQGSAGELHIISSSPFEQPCLELLNANLDIRRIHKMTPIDLTNSPAELQTNLRQLNTRQRATVARYFTKEQITVLTGADKQLPLAELRENYLVPFLTADTTEQKTEAIKKLLPDTAGENCARLKNCLNKSGMTLVAALNPYQTAMNLCGFNSEEDYFKAKHDMQSLARNTISSEQKRQKAQERAAKSKHRDEDAYSDEDEDRIIRVKVGRVELTAAEMEDILHDNDIDTLIFLAHGIVISSDGANRTARKLFQRAVLSLPETLLETTTKRPPIHCLITDYSGIFGIDCAGIKRVILMDDLAALLTPDDIVQATGRVRREGQILVLNPHAATKLLGFTQHNWDSIITDKITSILSAKPHSNLQEQKAIIRELRNQPIAGIVYTSEELLFKVFLQFVCKPDFKSAVKPWSAGIFGCEWNFSETDKYMLMFKNQTQSTLAKTNSLAALCYMYNIIDFDLVAIQNWLKQNSTLEELQQYAKFIEFIEEPSDDEATSNSGEETE
jgi:hypothetical protein